MEQDACRCGCGEAATPDSGYAGSSPAERSKHRVARKRAEHKQEQQRAAARAAALQHLGLTTVEEARVSDLNERLTAALQDSAALSLVLTAAALDDDAVAARIEAATGELRERAERQTTVIGQLRDDLAAAQTAMRAAEERCTVTERDANSLAADLADCQARLHANQELCRRNNDELAVVRADLARIQVQNATQRTALKAALVAGTRDQAVLAAALEEDLLNATPPPS